MRGEMISDHTEQLTKSSRAANQQDKTTNVFGATQLPPYIIPTHTHTLET